MPTPGPRARAVRHRVQSPRYVVTCPARQEQPDRPRVITGGRSMATKITSDVLESYLHCKFKGYLKLAGQQGTVSDYEALLARSRNEVRQKATEKILSRYKEDEVASQIPLVASALGRGPLFVLDATLEDDQFALRFDGLKKVDGASKLGDFHYVPVLFHEGRSVRKEQRSLLELYGLLLFRVQGRAPASGVVWHGKECKATRVRLRTDQREAERVLRGLQEMRGAEPPRLILNDHCQICEFRQRCQTQAVQEDSISLLRVMAEREVRRYARKGIFTLTQLSYTFRLRKKNRRAKQRGSHHYPALKALAIRDKKTYILGTPEVPDRAVKVYLDMEGLPEEGYVYLIGLIVVENGSARHHSFWADSKDQEV